MNKDHKQWLILGVLFGSFVRYEGHTFGFDNASLACQSCVPVSPSYGEAIGYKCSDKRFIPKCLMLLLSSCRVLSSKVLGKVAWGPGIYQKLLLIKFCKVFKVKVPRF